MVAGCSNVIDEKDIPVVTIPDTGSSADTTVAGGALDPTQPITLGTVTLDPCTDITGAWCGAIDVPLERAHPDGDQIKIGFELHPRTDATTSSEGTIVAIEGGPGFSSTGSRDSYLNLFTPIMDHRDLLLVDDRGTGRSSPLDCKALQDGDDSLDAADECAVQLGSSADDYGAAAVADDVNAVLEALGAGHCRLYGDSYGTFVAQAFAATRRQALTSVVLDSALPVSGGVLPRRPHPGHVHRVRLGVRTHRSVQGEGRLELRTHQGAAPLAPGVARAGVDDRPRRAERRGVGRPREPPVALAVRCDRLDRLPRARCSRDVVARR